MDSKTSGKTGNDDDEIREICKDLDDIMNSISDDDDDPSLPDDKTKSKSLPTIDKNEKVEEKEQEVLKADSGQSLDVEDISLPELLDKIDCEKAKDTIKDNPDESNSENEEEIRDKVFDSLFDDIALKNDLTIPEETEVNSEEEKEAPSGLEKSSEKNCEAENIFPESELSFAGKNLVIEEIVSDSSKSSTLLESQVEKSCETIEKSSDCTKEELESDATEKVSLETSTGPLTLLTSTDVIPGDVIENNGAMEVDSKVDTQTREKTPLKLAIAGGSRPADSRLSETPEDLINMLKMLSPEKLEVIKSQLFNTSKETEKSVENPATSDEKSEEQMDTTEADVSTKQTKPEEAVIETEAAKTSENQQDKKDDEEMDVDDNEVAKIPEKDKTPPNVEAEDVAMATAIENKDDDCVILLDSDEEAEDRLKDEIADVQPKVFESNIEHLETTPQPPLQQESLEKLVEQKPGKVISAKNFECVNNDCPRDSKDFIESPQFVLHFYGASKKSGRVEYVCSSCQEKALIKFEEMGEALLNNRPIFEIEVPKKNEMVEVIDSDDEDASEEPRVLSAAEKIVWNTDVELKVEDILRSFCGQIDFEKQLKFGHDDVKQRSSQLALEQTKFGNDLQRLEKLSNSMYNNLYSINLPKIERRPSIELCDEYDAPKQFTGSLKDLLTSKSQPMQSRTGITIKAVEQQSILKPAPNPTPPPTPTPTPIRIAPKPSPVVMPAQIQPQPVKKVVLMRQQIVPNVEALTIKQEAPKIELVHYAVRSRAEGKMQNWVACKLLETTTLNDNTKLYRVHFLDNLPNAIATVKGKDISINTINPKLKIGARVIAQFSKPSPKYKEVTKRFIPGVIGEKLSKHNNQRYLVFCDYGQVLYAGPHAVREVMECSPNVWEDVHDNLRQFIFDYLQSQTVRQRALLNVRNGQVVKTERNGEWKDAVVAAIDCSIIKMLFSGDQSYEWLYRGSKRLGPLFQQGNRSYNTNARRNDPNISYITIDDDVEQPAPEVKSEVKPEEKPETKEEIEKKNTARKSTAPAQPHMRILQQHQAQLQQQQPQTGPITPIILNDDNIYIEEPIVITKQRHFTPKAGIAAKRYVAHSCSPSCLVAQAGTLSQYSPLSKPLLTYWERLIVRQKHNRWIQYKAPCGRRLRDMYEIHKYLKMTKCFLNVDNFDFDVNIAVLSSYEVIDKAKCPLYIADMSNGKEGMKIPIINAFDNQAPAKLEYSAVRLPMTGVHINTDPAFRSCCDCTDDCADKTKCACFQLTTQGMKFAYPNEELLDDDISYVWKRLLNPVQTGIYECGTQCKCSNRCLNKVVQQPIQIKMQLFRTKDRGWGLQCCHDIPKGTFICIYAGKLYREEDANALCLGLNHGDEYFAELDIIETATPLKNGYETGVVYEDSDTEEEKASDSDSDYDERKAEKEDADFASRPKTFGSREIVTRSTRGEIRKNKESTEMERKASVDSDSDSEIVNVMPKAGGNPESEPKTHRNLRKFYGKNERVYIMDAKECGNVGRYFNHCCDPNLIVQSVFVDTHDLRFPWIAFFASRAIKAGEELTWNYNYEVGSVASKILNCKCRSKNCRGRIL